MPLSKKIIWGNNGIARKLNWAPDNRIDELKLRHKMLQTHQKLALLSLGLTAYQTYIGKELLDRKNGERSNLHRTLGYSTFTVYMTAAGFSIFALVFLAIFNS